MQEYLDDLNEGNAPTNAYYGLSTKGYENLSANMAGRLKDISAKCSILYNTRNLDEELEDESDERGRE